MEESLRRFPLFEADLLLTQHSHEKQLLPLLLVIFTSDLDCVEAVSIMIPEVAGTD